MTYDASNHCTWTFTKDKSLKRAHWLCVFCLAPFSVSLLVYRMDLKIKDNSACQLILNRKACLLPPFLLWMYLEQNSGSWIFYQLILKMPFEKGQLRFSVGKRDCLMLCMFLKYSNILLSCFKSFKSQIHSLLKLHLGFRC